ncbi:hypothetical protein GBL_1419 [Geobacillus kaustophilus GBlys]|uniref:Uncharacterized protein n=1 Tax=Geobacillus kaustophilus GBlys TaxID=1337888 RepID=U2X3M8_GEOKU|nr:hypothetical protein GBL_1419 [Geobacillus kaustophilus GBlys]
MSRERAFVKINKMETVSKEKVGRKNENPQNAGDGRTSSG